jgi:hypothetical protein
MNIGSRPDLENLAKRVGGQKDREALSERMRELAARLQRTKNTRRPEGVAPHDDAAEALIHSHTFLEDGIKQISAAFLALFAPKNTAQDDLRKMLEEVLTRCDESRAIMADLLEQIVNQREGNNVEEIFPTEVVEEADFTFEPNAAGEDVSISDLWTQIDEVETPVVAQEIARIDTPKRPRLTL